MPRCLMCDQWSPDPFCSTHNLMYRFEKTIEPDFDQASEHLKAIVKTVWYDRDKEVDIDEAGVEALLAENPNIAVNVIKYFRARGYGNWHKYINARHHKFLACTVTDAGIHFVRVKAEGYSHRVNGNSWRQLTNLNPVEQNYMELKFWKRDWSKVRPIISEGWPLTEFPDIQAIEPEYAEMLPVVGDFYTSHCAINSGEIVAGKYLRDKTGEPVLFHQVFEDCVRRPLEVLSEQFGCKHIAPANVHNLTALIENTQEPWETKMEASRLISKIKSNAEMIGKAFQWRLKTKLYEEGKLHRYSYEEKDNFPFGKTEKRIGEQWNSYINHGYKLYSHQKICCEVAWEFRRLGLWLDMRLGKTLIGIALAKRALAEGLVDRLVVVCPVTNMYDPWDSELEKQNFSIYTCDQGSKIDEQAFNDDDYDAYIISYESLRNRLPLMQDAWDMERVIVVMDETSAIKNPKAQRTMAATMLCEHPAFVYALNGTPMEQGPADIWSQQYAIDKGITFGVSYDSFLHQYMFQADDRRWYLRKDKVTDFELNLASSAMRYIRSEGDQFAGKDKNFRYIGLPPSKEMHDSTSRIISGFQVTDWGDAQLVKSCVLVTYGHLREAAAGYDKYETFPDSGEYTRRRHKLDLKTIWVRTFLKSNPGQSLVCFCEFTEAEDRLMEMLEAEGIEYSCTRQLHGSTYSPHERLEQINNFNSGKTRVFICKTVQARGITLNRIEAVKNGQGTYPSIVYMQPSWSLGNWKQSQDRCVGTDPNTNKSIATMIYVLAVEGSIECAIVKALRSKQKVAETLLKDAGRDGYSNPFEDMDLSKTDRKVFDEFFDAEDYESRYVLGLSPPPKKLTEKEVKKAAARYWAKKKGIKISQAGHYPGPLEATFLLNKLSGDSEQTEQVREALNATNVITMADHSGKNTQPMAEDSST